jgi:hypothetical protein
MRFGVMLLRDAAQETGRVLIRTLAIFLLAARSTGR